MFSSTRASLPSPAAPTAGGDGGGGLVGSVPPQAARANRSESATGRMAMAGIGVLGDIGCLTG
jgi:hypothetical protein